MTYEKAHISERVAFTLLFTGLLWIACTGIYFPLGLAALDISRALGASGEGWKNPYLWPLALLVPGGCAGALAIWKISADVLIGYPDAYLASRRAEGTAP